MREQDDQGEDSSSIRTQVSPDDVSALLRAFSHDLATPLANIKLASAVLVSAEGRLPEETLAELGRSVSSEADRLRRMVDTLVEWNHLEIGKRQLHQEWHLVEDLIGSALRGLEALLDDKKVVVTIEPDMAFVRGDELLLERVLTNLIDNAVHCTASGDPIEIVARADETSCTVEVLDAGPRFDSEEEMAVEARCSSRTGQAGAPGGGLGLVVSRMIIEAHGGNIWARNRDDESGAVFAFVLGYGGESPPHAPLEATLGDDGTD